MVNPNIHRVLDEIPSHYDRRQEVEAFDSTKAGVRGLVEDGVTKVPRMFFSPPDWNSEKIASKDSDHFRIPVIDLGGTNLESVDAVGHKEIVSQVRRAAETWGFFQIVDHGIPVEILDEMLQGVRKFHELPKEERSKYYTRNASKGIVYNSNFDLYTAPAANWRDTIACFVTPVSPNPDDLPREIRDTLKEYSKQIMKLGVALFELLSEALGLNPSHLNDMGCSEGLVFAGHYYPKCPEPELTMGTSKHSDNDFLTVLLQDQLGGLQVHFQDEWIDVTPMHGGLVVNVGDLLQLISNDKFKSAEHRVLSNHAGPRMSASFFSTTTLPSTRTFGPIKELLSQENPPLYREIMIPEYVKVSNEKGLDGTSPLSQFKL
ncbi:hypothetical protein Sjap_017824 [Stephania japonica]|uniref:Fe2OG dioxygenase domain-containing protein n=1 Tax=Stephania japonica TaxID=461633 RepID=A0AAP0NKF2_9MAGN